MSLKSTINGQIKAGQTFREQIDGETITISGTAYIGTFSSIDDEFMPQEAGYREREQLRGVLRIDQFLGDPSTFDPALDYRAQLPARTVKPTLRGRLWRITDTKTDHDSWIIDLEEIVTR